MTEKERFAQVEQKIIEWAREKGILEQSTEERQAIKTLQELGELADAFERGDVEAIKMELGDVWVTLIIRNYMTFPTLPAADYFTYDRDDIEASSALLNIADAAINLCVDFNDFKDTNLFTNHFGFTLTDALEAAYEKISKRTGKMVNGLWVKEKV